MWSELRIGDTVFVRDGRLEGADPDWKEIAEYRVLKIGRTWITLAVPGKEWTQKEISREGEFKNYSDNNHLLAFRSKTELADHKWFMRNRRRITETVSRCRDINKLRRIAEVIDEPI